MIRCKHCTSTTMLGETAARVYGWRLFSGVSQTGKAFDDVACPVCAGTAKDPVSAASWSVRCTTCDWSSDEGNVDEDDMEILGAQAAVMLGKDHECEPDIQLRKPAAGAKWLPIDDFNRDGSLRRLRGRGDLNVGLLAGVSS